MAERHNVDFGLLRDSVLVCVLSNSLCVDREKERERERERESYVDEDCSVVWSFWVLLLVLLQLCHFRFRRCLVGIMIY